VSITANSFRYSDVELLQFVQFVRKNFPSVEVIVNLDDGSYAAVPFEDYFRASKKQREFFESLTSLLK